MNRKNIFYYLIVSSFFLIILITVYYVVNTTRVFVNYEESINPTEIMWEVDPEDSTLRIKDPVYLTNDYILVKNQYFKAKQDSAIFNQLFNDTIFVKGCIMNLKPPYLIWKSSNNDTIKIIKNEKTLKFIKRI